MTPYYTDASLTLYGGDCRGVLAELPAESVDCIVTSPPYWGLRDYGIEPSVWGGDPDHTHEWSEPIVQRAAGYEPGEKARWNHRHNGRGEAQERILSKEPGWTRKDIVQGACCSCGAWVGALGLEPTPEQFVENMVAVFQELRRVLKPTGTAWLNLGDCYATGAGRVGEHPGGGAQGARWRGDTDGANRGFRGKHLPNQAHMGKHPYRAGVGPMTQPNRLPLPGLKAKDLVGVPWRVAFALQADGWYLRSDIVWSKPNPMPESVRDRPTKSHEYLFLLSRSERYYYDADAIREPGSTTRAELLEFGERPELGFPGHSPDRRRAKIKMPDGWDTGPGGHGSFHRNGREKGKQRLIAASGSPSTQRQLNGLNERWEAAEEAGALKPGRNRRSVWTVATAPYPGAHFATFPPKLIEPCILAGAPDGGVVLDPFAGSGTVGMVANRLSRRAILIDLNPAYLEQQMRRNAQQPLSLAEVRA